MCREEPILDPAALHHVSAERVLEAYWSARWSAPLGPGKEMWLGHDFHGNLLELGVSYRRQGVVIFHAMRARPFWRREYNRRR